MNTLKVGPVKSKRSTHVFVHEALTASGPRDAQKAGSMLRSLHRTRNDADYDIAVDSCGQQQLAHQSVVDANNIKALIESCANNPAAITQMQAQIALWRRTTGN